MLCEDRQQEVFLRYYLAEKGYDSRAIYAEVAPRGRGAGEQFVREHYPDQVRAVRTVPAMRSGGVAVMIDADARSVDERHRQLGDELVARSIAPRSLEDRIAVLVPKRNIETWLHYLLGDNPPVDENEGYRRLSRESDCRPAARRLAALCPPRPPLPSNCPPSLARGCAELTRLP